MLSYDCAANDCLNMENAFLRSIEKKRNESIYHLFHAKEPYMTAFLPLQHWISQVLKLIELEAIF